MTVLFTLLNVTLLTSGLYHLTKNYTSILASLVIVMLPSYVMSAISQYCDIVVSYFILASLCCLVLAYRTTRTIGTSGQGEKPFLILAAIFLGFLSFTKPEGMIAAILITAISLWFLTQKEKAGTEDSWKIIGFFLGCILIASSGPNP